MIYLYQRADFKKPTWLCRVKVPNGSSRPYFDAKDWGKLTRQLREFVKVENGAVIGFRVGTVDVTRVSVPVTAPINLTGVEGFGLVSRLLLSPGLLCEDNNVDSSTLNCGYQLGAKLVANDNDKGSFYADYRWESVGAMRRSLLGMGYAYRFGPKNGLEVAVEANRGLSGGLGQDNRAMLSLP